MDIAALNYVAARGPGKFPALRFDASSPGLPAGLKPKQKTQVRAVREKKGIRAAIGVARRMREVA